MHQAYATPSKPVPAIVERMADKMRWHAAGSGGCTVEHLKAEGFNGFEIEVYGDQAAHHAKAGRVRHVDQDAKWQLEPVPGQDEPLAIAFTPGSREFYVKSMLSIARSREDVPLTRKSLETLLIGAGFDKAALALCIQEVYATLHPGACDAAPPVAAPIDAYQLPLAAQRLANGLYECRLVLAGKTLTKRIAISH